MKNELAAAWIASALADLKSIEHLKDDEFLTHIVAFHAQQCVEKCFKALLETSIGEVPRIHSTLKLFAMVRNELKCELDTDLLTDLDALYIDARYPGDLGLLPDGKPTLANAREFYDFARKIFNIINSRF
jgi:HEPN domain-containing protein